MPRTRTALTLLCTALLCAAAARALSTRYAERRRQLEAEASAQRTKLGLDGDRVKLYALYPTPEVTFDGDPARAAPGGTATIKVKGRFPKGTVFLFNDDELSVLSEKASATTYEAQVRLSKDALPASVRLVAKAPVSLAEQSMAVLRVAGRYDFDLTFEDGWRAQLHTSEADDDGNLTLDATWTKAGDKRSPRKNQVTLSRAEEGLDGELRRTEDDLASLGIEKDLAAMREPSGGEDLDKLMPEATEKMRACEKLAAEAQTACIEKAMAKVSAMTGRMKERLEAAQADIAAKMESYACDRLRVRGPASKLRVDEDCGGERSIRGTGTARAIAP